MNLPLDNVAKTFNHMVVKEEIFGNGLFPVPGRRQIHNRAFQFLRTAFDLADQAVGDILEILG